jgi:hypothetical protein
MWETIELPHTCPPEWTVCFSNPDDLHCERRRAFCLDAEGAAEKAVEEWDDDGCEGPSESIEVFVRRSDAVLGTPWQRFKVIGEYTVTYSAEEIEDDKT